MEIGIKKSPYDFVINGKEPPEIVILASQIRLISETGKKPDISEQHDESPPGKLFPDYKAIEWYKR